MHTPKHCSVAPAVVYGQLGRLACLEAKLVTDPAPPRRCLGRMEQQASDRAMEERAAQRPGEPAAIKPAECSEDQRASEERAKRSAG